MAKEGGSVSWKPLMAIGIAVFLVFSPCQVFSKERKTAVSAPKKRERKRVHRRVSNSRPRLVTTSWYGPRFHGREMANGRPFNRYAISAAHKTLPLGIQVRVTNPQTGASLVVPITDRGPYIQGRQLDLSEEAAERLGVKEEGVARVWLEINW